MTDGPAKRILIVDDEPLARRFFTEILNRGGYQTQDVHDAESALDVLAKSIVHLVLTDVHMPGKSGIDLLKEIRRSANPVPVIITTGKPTVKAAVECIKVGAIDYLPKPVGMRRLLETVKQALETVEAVDTSAETSRLPGHPGRERLEEYRIIRTLGTGNMGLVFLAEKDTPEGPNRFAVKVIRPELLDASESDREKAIQRFCREAESAMKVDHPGVVKIIDYNLLGYDRVPYLVMEYVDGIALDRWACTRPDADYVTRARLVLQITEALAAIHAAGICHRDIKPANILVTEDGIVKLTDFGVARSVDITLSTDLLGTPAYMAPECFQTTKASPPGDVFSLGVVAYELLLGTRPFSGDSIPSLVREICSDPPIAPVKRDAAFPLCIQNVLARMLKKDQGWRYPDAAAAVSDLQKCVQSLEDQSGSVDQARVSQEPGSHDDWDWQ